MFREIGIALKTGWARAREAYAQARYESSKSFVAEYDKAHAVKQSVAKKPARKTVKRSAE